MEEWGFETRFSQLQHSHGLGSNCDCCHKKYMSESSMTELAMSTYREGGNLFKVQNVNRNNLEWSGVNQNECEESVCAAWSAVCERKESADREEVQIGNAV